MKPVEWLGEATRSGQLQPIELAVLCALWSFMDRYGRCHPSLDTIAQRAGISRRHTVTKQLNSLAEKGWIVRERRYPKKTNTYLMAMPKPVDNQQNVRTLWVRETHHPLVRETHQHVGTRNAPQTSSKRSKKGTHAPDPVDNCDPRLGNTLHLINPTTQLP